MAAFSHNSTTGQEMSSPVAPANWTTHCKAHGDGPPAKITSRWLSSIDMFRDSMAMGSIIRWGWLQGWWGDGWGRIMHGKRLVGISTEWNKTGPGWLGLLGTTEGYTEKPMRGNGGDGGERCPNNHHQQRLMEWVTRTTITQACPWELPGLSELPEPAKREAGRDTKLRLGAVVSGWWFSGFSNFGSRRSTKTGWSGEAMDNGVLVRTPQPTPRPKIQQTETWICFSME